MYLYTPAGEVNPFGNGAAKRSAQIFNLLNRNFPLKNTREIRYAFLPRLKKYYKGFKILRKNNIRIQSIRQIAIAGHHYCNLEKIAAELKPSEKLWFWESILTDYYLKPNILHDLGFKLFAFPHNLESLVPGQQSALSGAESPHWFFEEINQFKLCKHVFTISREEQWLLSLYNIESTWFPYYPPAEVETELLAVRDFRVRHESGEFFFMFGSFSYGPILNGVKRFLKFLYTCNLNIKLKISGFDSEQIASKLDFSLPDNIEIIGASSAQQLYDLLGKCKAVIINQAASSGALTKIKELQIAGVPVVINYESTRSYDLYPGLYPFHSLDELQILLKKDLQMPEMPKRNSVFENKVVKIIQSEL